MSNQDELLRELQQKSLSTKLKELGFDERSFMSVSMEARVGDRYNNDGSVTPSRYLSWGPDHTDPNDKTLTDGMRNDMHIGASIGGVGANNGVYSAQIKGVREIVITEDRKIYDALKNLGFKEGMGVPMSNGGIFVDPEQQKEYKTMKNVCARNRIAEGQERRTAAVERNGIVTTYDPEDRWQDGTLKNTRHFAKDDKGDYYSISSSEARHALQTNNPDKQEGIKSGKKLDSDTMRQVISHSYIRD